MGRLLTSRQRLRLAMRSGQEKGQGREWRSARAICRSSVMVYRPLLTLPIGGTGTGTKGQE